VGNVFVECDDAIIECGGGVDGVEMTVKVDAVEIEAVL
jgi:hypothetical protein